MPEEFLDPSNPFYAAKKALKEQTKQTGPAKAGVQRHQRRGQRYPSPIDGTSPCREVVVNLPISCPLAGPSRRLTTCDTGIAMARNRDQTRLDAVLRLLPGLRGFASDDH